MSEIGSEIARRLKVGYNDFANWLRDWKESQTCWVPDNMPPPRVDMGKLQYIATVNLNAVEPGTVIGVLTSVMATDNGVTNWKIFREAGFKNIFIHPAAGDSGGALGAALYL